MKLVRQSSNTCQAYQYIYSEDDSVMQGRQQDSPDSEDEEEGSDMELGDGQNINPMHYDVD